jgi:hypothetical protein
MVFMVLLLDDAALLLDDAALLLDDALLLLDGAALVLEDPALCVVDPHPAVTATKIPNPTVGSHTTLCFISSPLYLPETIWSQICCLSDTLECPYRETGLNRGFGGGSDREQKQERHVHRLLDSENHVVKCLLDALDGQRAAVPPERRSVARCGLPESARRRESQTKISWSDRRWRVIRRRARSEVPPQTPCSMW